MCVQAADWEGRWGGRGGTSRKCAVCWPKGRSMSGGGGEADACKSAAEKRGLDACCSAAYDTSAARGGGGGGGGGSSKQRKRERERDVALR